MDWIGIGILAASLGGIAAIMALYWWLGQREIDKARQWPQTEATVEFAAIEPYTRKSKLPTFGFSYRIAGDYYSGRFSLLPDKSGPCESLLPRVVGRKLQIHYDPARPETWFIPDERIEECKVGQKIGPHFAPLYPK